MIYASALVCISYFDLDLGCAFRCLAEIWICRLHLYRLSNADIHMLLFYGSLFQTHFKILFSLSVILMNNSFAPRCFCHFAVTLKVELTIWYFVIINNIYTGLIKQLLLLIYILIRNMFEALLTVWERLFLTHKSVV